MRLGWIGLAVLLSGCAGLGGTDASAPMTSVTGSQDGSQIEGMVLHSAGSGASMGSDTELGGGAGSQGGTAMGAGGIGNGIPQ